MRLAGNRGGLVVHVDCGDGKLTAELGRHKGVIVQGLTRDAWRRLRRRDSGFMQVASVGRSRSACGPPNGCPTLMVLSMC